MLGSFHLLRDSSNQKTAPGFTLDADDRGSTKTVHEHLLLMTRREARVQVGVKGPEQSSSQCH